MRRSIAWFSSAALLLTAACAARARPNAIAPYAGTWQGSVIEAVDNGVRLTYTWVQSSDSTGTLTIGRNGLTVPTRIVAANADSVVVEATRPAQLPLVDAASFSLRFVGQVRGNSMTGTAVGRSPIGAIREGRIEATRVETTARP